MCGRYVLEGPISRLTEYFDARYTADEIAFKNSYNIAPTAQIPVVRINRAGERVILNHLWGLIPSWSKDRSVGAKLNNARGETVHEKPSFRTAFKKFRCLIPARGYYEWQTPTEVNQGRKQPFYIYPSQSPYFAMAGICDHWTDESSGELVMSTAIVTTEPCGKLKGIHDRMPVLLPEHDWAAWLDPKNQDVPSVRQFISSNSEVSFHPVGPKNQDVPSVRQFISSNSEVSFHPVGFGVSAVGKNRVDVASLIQLIVNESG